MYNISMNQFVSFIKNNTYIMLACVLIAIGGGFFLINWPYAEDGQEILFLIYLGLCLVIAFKEAHFLGNLTVLSVILAVGVLGYSHQKFEWRKNYVIQSQSGNHFVLDHYIEHYPAYENYLFRSVSGQSNYIDFANDCYKPALNKQQVGSDCRSVNLIKSRYNIDINMMIDAHYKLMQKTAKLFEQNRITNKTQYAKCIADKRCAIIPLLPTNTNIDDIEKDKDAYIDIRRQFWSLLDKDNKFITPEICDFMDLCRVMRDINVVSIAKPWQDNI